MIDNRLETPEKHLSDVREASNSAAEAFDRMGDPSGVTVGMLALQMGQNADMAKMLYMLLKQIDERLERLERK
jgi:hypothetical protein